MEKVKKISKKVKVDLPKVKNTIKKQIFLQKQNTVPEGYVRVDKQTTRIYHVFASSDINAGDTYLDKHAKKVKKLEFNEKVKIPKITPTMRKKVVRILNNSGYNQVADINGDNLVDVVDIISLLNIILN